MKKIFFTTLIFVTMLSLGQSICYAQTDSIANELQSESFGNPNKVYMKIRSYGDSIVIRWAPENAAVWLLGNAYGWNVVREKTNEEFTSELDTVLFITLNGDKPIVPMTLEEMKQAFDSTDNAAGAAAQALYGPVPIPVSAEDDNFFNYAFRKNQEQELRQLSAYLVAEEDARMATALGMRFVDTTVKAGQWYKYSLVSLIPEEYALLTLPSVLVECKPFERSDDELVPPIFIEQKDAFSAVIYWQKNELTRYYIEKSTNKGKTWEKINTAPIYASDPDESDYAVFGQKIGKLKEKFVVFIDSLGLDTTYTYRIRAFDTFGDETPYNQSDEFTMIDLIPPSIPSMVACTPANNKDCTVEWYKDRNEKDFKGFVLTFADNPEGPWSKVSDLLPPKTRYYIDHEAGERGRGYYRVFAVDESGNISYSLSMINNIEDEKAPSPPTGFEAMVDSTGSVYFQWNSNPEKDVMGYRVYFANQLDHAFAENSPGILEELFYNDTIDLHTLTPFVYYYVVAEDFSHNISKPSDTIAVPIPDIVSPGIALLEDYTQDNQSVSFRWRKSSSEDVLFYYIYRKAKNAKQWQCIKVLTAEEVDQEDFITFVDQPAPSHIAYNYCIEVLDDARLSSGKAGIVTVLFKGENMINVPIKIEASVNKKGNAVNITWSYEYDSDFDHYGVIYKSVNNGEYDDCTKFNRGETSYTDNKVKDGDKVNYYIQLFLGNGKRSNPSRTVNVKM